MSSYSVQRPDAEDRPLRLYLFVATVVAAALLAVAVPFLRAEVVVAGETQRVLHGATVADLIDVGLLTPVSGDLLDVEGALLEEGGGAEAVLLLNDRATGSRELLADGDYVYARPGSNVIEATETVRAVIEIPMEMVGSGPLISLEHPGAAGVSESAVGSISRKVMSTRVITPVQPMVVRRSVPEPGSRVVALTFDDGPWPGQTDRILDILAEQEVKASFFPVGYLVERHPELARRIAEEGHVVGNHTAGHLVLTGESPERVRQQILGGVSAIRSVTGVESTWFRPPGGRIDPSVLTEAKAAGQKLVLWDVDPQDWRRPGTEAILARVLDGVRPGSVVLLHDGGGNRTQTIAMLPRLIEELKERGYVFVTLDELRR